MTVFSNPCPTTMAESRSIFEEAECNFEHKATHHMERFGSAEQLAFAQCLLGQQSNRRLGLASDMASRLRYATSTFKHTRSLWEADPKLEFRMVSIIRGQDLTSDENTCIDLSALKRDCRYILRAVSPNYLGTVEFQVMANVKHADGGKQLCAHSHLLCFGHDICDHAYDAVQKANARLPPLPNGMAPAHVTEAASDIAALRRILFYPLKPPDKCKTLYVSGDGRRTNLHESIKGDRMIRYERMLEILSSLPLRDLMFAGGLGRAIKTAALRKAEAGQPTIDTQEKVRSFWRKWRRQSGTTRFAAPHIY